MCQDAEIPRDPATTSGMESQPRKDPYIQVGYLQQCLSSNKRPIGLFLGAGCPMGIRTGAEPLIPDIGGLTKKIITILQSDQELKLPFEKVLSHFSEDRRGDPTIETLLSHIRSLKVVAGNGEVRGLAMADLEKLDKRMCGIVQEAVDKTLPTSWTPYHQLATWTEAIARESPVEVFTTNYDLLVEQAFEDIGVPFFDGFAGSRKPFFDLESVETDKLPPRWARLWKLHGSINWYQIMGKGVFRGSTTEPDDRRVIHPSHLKYEESRRMPYLVLIDRLRSFFKAPANAMVLCGYSFRDEHINEVIVQGLQSTPNSVAFALLFGSLAGYSDAIQLALRRSNLILLAEDGAVLSGVQVSWTDQTEEPAKGLTTNRWIKWAPVDPMKPEGIKRAIFQLGDFNIFGNFLQDLIGNRTHPLEISDGH